MMYLGIDPGANGGMAALAYSLEWTTTPIQNLRTVPYIHFTTMPRTERGVLDWLIRVCQKESTQTSIKCALEKVVPGFSGSSKSSIARLYGNYTALRMALESLHIKYETPTASEWHRGLSILPRGRGEGRSEWKGRLLGEAKRRFPQVYPTLSTGDALLIAEYCRLENAGKEGE
jgi:hypothetical protein